MSVEILVGDALTRLDEMPDKSVHCAVTSPPYWGLRSYHLTKWIGGDPDCEHLGKPVRGENSDSTWHRPSRSAQKYQPVCRYCGAEEVVSGNGIGLEPTFEQHVDKLMLVFDQLYRVLRDDGTLWLNYGDRYYTNNGTPRGNGVGLDGNARGGSFNSDGSMFSQKRTKHDVFGHKQLMLMPARIAIAMQERGWLLRSEIIWHKTNAMPSSVKDRPTESHEKVFLFAKKQKYFYDHVAISTPSKNTNAPGSRTNGENHDRNDNDMAERIKANGTSIMANLRNVWPLATTSYKGAHFAVFPAKLVEPCIKAGTSEKGVCSECGSPYHRIYEKIRPEKHEVGGGRRRQYDEGGGENIKDRRDSHVKLQTKTWKPSCDCDADIVPATVLDPFGGAGTTALVADRLGRNATIIEISAEYANLAKERLFNDSPLGCMVDIKWLTQ